jgi:enamine deaminase RidA (YjgF/YER057c/UK114 family)
VADMTIFNPEKLAKPLGPLSHIARAKAAELVFIAGQVAVDGAGNLVGSGDFDAQCVQVFANIAAALDAVGAGWGNVAQFTTYLVRASDVAGFTGWREREFPQMFPDGAYPPNTLLIVDRLAQEAFLIEVQAIAAL